MEFYRLLALSLAIGAALGVGLSVGGAFSDGLDRFTHFVPLYLLAGVTALMMLAPLGTGRSRTATVAALAAVAVSAAFMAPELVARFARRPRAAGDQTVKIIQFNLWSNNVDPEGTAAWLAAQDADVVVLEEVVTRSAGVPKSLTKAYPYQRECEEGLACTTMILSKIPPRASGGYPSPDEWGLHSGAWATFGEGSRAFTVVGLHALWPTPPGIQQSQSALMVERLRAFDQPSLIFAGDFNSTPWSFSLRRQDALLGLVRRTRALFTWPVRPYSRYRLRSPVPLTPIDHIYAGASWKTVSVTRGPRLGSDHLPVVAVLTR